MKKTKRLYDILDRLDNPSITQHDKRNRNTRNITFSPNATGVRGHEHTHTKNGVDPIDSVLDEGALALTTRGDIVYMSATDLARLAIGTSDFYLKSDGTDPLWARIMADEVEVAELSTATYDDVQDFINLRGSRGLASGGGITDNTDGTCQVAAGTGMVRVDDTNVAELRFFDWSVDTNVSLTDESTNVIYIDYNSGTPQIAVDVNYSNCCKQTYIMVAVIYRDGTELHILELAPEAADTAARISNFQREHHDALRVSGLVTSNSGTQRVAISEGVIWHGLTRLPFSAFDSDNGDRFSLLSTADSGSSWTQTDNVQDFPDEQYNDITIGLQDLTTNKYGVLWVYVTNDGADVYMQYGQGNYTLAGALSAQIPSVLHYEMADFSILIAKLVFQKGAGTFTVYLPWVTTFGGEEASDHGNLTGLSDDDHTQYLLADGTRELTDDMAVTALKTIDGRDLSVDGTKLDGIEALADVTDATNVDTAGAVMETDTDASGWGSFLDEDDMASDDATKMASQQSIKKYVDDNAGGDLVDDATPQLGGDLDVNEFAIQDGDGDTKLQLEEGADDDHARIDVAGVEAFLLHDNGILELPKQSGGFVWHSAADTDEGSGAWAFSVKPLSPTGPERIPFDVEVSDVQSEFSVALVNECTGAAASTGTTFVATAATFAAGDVGKMLYNVTDETFAEITVYTNTTTVTVNQTIGDTWDGDTVYMYSSRFTATEDGIYNIGVAIEIGSLDDASYAQLYVYVNNAAKAYLGQKSSGAATTHGLFLGFNYALSAGDYVDIRMQHQDTGNSRSLVSFIHMTYWSIGKIA